MPQMHDILLMFIWSKVSQRSVFVSFTCVQKRLPLRAVQLNFPGFWASVSGFDAGTESIKARGERKKYLITAPGNKTQVSIARIRGHGA